MTGAAAMAASPRAKIAAVITAYYRNSHADVFIGNMLRGYYWEGKPHESATGDRGDVPRASAFERHRARGSCQARHSR